MFPAVPIRKMGSARRASTNDSPDARSEEVLEPDDNECVVRCAPDEPNLTVELTILGKQRILSRMQEDPLSSTLDRLVKLFSEKGKYGAGGKGKKKKVKGKGKRRQALAESEASAAAQVPSSQEIRTEQLAPFADLHLWAMLRVAGAGRGAGANNMAGRS
eukprot:338457-Rhodomonas_salina.2